MTYGVEVLTKPQIEALTPTAYKTYENKLRRAALRQDIRLEKSRVRDPRGYGHNTYQLVDEYTGSPVLCAEEGYGLHLADIAEFLWGPPQSTWTVGTPVRYVGITGVADGPTGRIVKVLKTGPIVEFDDGGRHQIHPRDLTAIR